MESIYTTLFSNLSHAFIAHFYKKNDRLQQRYLSNRSQIRHLFRVVLIPSISISETGYPSHRRWRSRARLCANRFWQNLARGVCDSAFHCARQTRDLLLAHQSSVESEEIRVHQKIRGRNLVWTFDGRYQNEPWCPGSYNDHGNTHEQVVHD